jgi:two-component system, LytTR family, sensor kinase
MIIDHPSPVARNPPRARGVYWVCLALGWLVFFAIVAGAYLYSAGSEWRATSVINIIWITLVVCPAASHGLRWLMWRRAWVDMVPSRRFARVVPSVLVAAVATTAMTGASLFLLEGPPWIPPIAMLSMTVNFAIAFGTYCAIYFGVLGRWRHEEMLRAAREAQLHMLKAQLNPHFLFNCLNSVRALIVEDPARAASMVTGLSDLLRYSLASDRHDTVTLAEELVAVDDYIRLERMRFDERLHTTRDIAPEALTARVPPMIVQTLVENAVKHGISNFTAGGTIALRASISGPFVEITVTNPGAFQPSDNGHGHGLLNARERLRLLYGSPALLTVESRGTDTVASVRVPLGPTA